MDRHRYFSFFKDLSLQACFFFPDRKSLQACYVLAIYPYHGRIICTLSFSTKLEWNCMLCIHGIQPHILRIPHACSQICSFSPVPNWPCHLTQSSGCKSKLLRAWALFAPSVRQILLPLNVWFRLVLVWLYVASNQLSGLQQGDRQWQCGLQSLAFSFRQKLF